MGAHHIISQMTTRARMNFAEASEAAINDQIMMELGAYYKYLSISSWLNRDDISLPGMAKYFYQTAVGVLCPAHLSLLTKLCRNKRTLRSSSITWLSVVDMSPIFSSMLFLYADHFQNFFIYISRLNGNPHTKYSRLASRSNVTSMRLSSASIRSPKSRMILH